MVHFEIHAEDIERAKKFYEDVFGWKIEKWEGPIEYWNITTGKQEDPGIDGGLMRRQVGEPGVDTPISTYICTIDAVSYTHLRAHETRGNLVCRL
ncbi:VOC family protein, partial [Methanosarcina sp. 2.H.T.1A.15]|uniref:VOC family protein n=1 Tax=Methanosarcina sp. 2.H.T.1A.15 TaxID=1483596 RepID=UPI000622108B